MSRRSNGTESRGARALKWVAGITAVISLILGARQLTSWLWDSLHRRREADTLVDLARQQASRHAFTDAWASLDKAEAVRPGDDVDSSRIDVAFVWLEEARPGPGRPFSVITDAVTPALDRALLNASGTRRADLLAHLGWATFLKSRDIGTGDPAAQYREALAIDPGNVYANAMLGHWLMWTGSTIDSARTHFNAALKGAGERRPFVRRLQLASLANRNAPDADAELIRVADDMRRNGERLDPNVADRIFWGFSLRYGPSGRAEGDIGLAPADLRATFEWVVKTSASAGRYGGLDALRQRLGR